MWGTAPVPGDQQAADADIEGLPGAREGELPLQDGVSGRPSRKRCFMHAPSLPGLLCPGCSANTTHRAHQTGPALRAGASSGMADPYQLVTTDRCPNTMAQGEKGVCEGTVTLLEAWSPIRNRQEAEGRETDRRKEPTKAPRSDSKSPARPGCLSGGRIGTASGQGPDPTDEQRACLCSKNDVGNL